MTLQQIRLVVETADSGSVSVAAEKLGISQPNASQSLKTLEAELGFPVFRRGSGGMTPTEEGSRFLLHARNMQQENEAIRSIVQGFSIPRLHVGGMNYTPVAEAFLRFCSETRELQKCDLSYLNVSPEQGAALLKDRSLDLMVLLLLKTSVPLAEQVSRENHFTLTKYTEIPICVNLRNGHPLLVSGALDGSLKSFSLLADYPYAEYKHLEHIVNSVSAEDHVFFGCSYKIYADEREVRMRLIGETNAYSVGCRIPEFRRKQFGITSVPIPDETATLITLIRKGDESRSEIKRYIDLLLEEIER